MTIKLPYLLQLSIKAFSVALAADTSRNGCKWAVDRPEAAWRKMAAIVLQRFFSSVLKDDRLSCCKSSYFVP